MALLLRDRDASSEHAAGAPGGDEPVVVPDFACATCAAAMNAGQDWCLECGTAAPGRLGARPGWRAAFTVVALTMLLVVGAVVASYAALTSDSQRQAAAPSQGPGAPIPAQGPGAVQPITPGATGPGTAPPAAGAPPAAPPAAGVAPPGSPPGAPPPMIPANPAPPATNTPVSPPAAPPPPAAPKKPAAPPADSKPAAPKPQIIKLGRDAAKTYDPASRRGAEFGPASYAVDGSPKTVWDVSVPADGKPIGAGLMINLGRPHSLRALTLATPTNGFRVEVYAAQSAKQTPEDILDKRWEHLTDIRGAQDGKLVSLLGKSKNKHQLLLLYVTDPAEPTDPRAAIGDVVVAGTP